MPSDDRKHRHHHPRLFESDSERGSTMGVEVNRPVWRAHEADECSRNGYLVGPFLRFGEQHHSRDVEQEVRRAEKVGHRKASGHERSDQTRSLVVAGIITLFERDETGDCDVLFGEQHMARRSAFVKPACGVRLNRGRQVGQEPAMCVGVDACVPDGVQSLRERCHDGPWGSAGQRRTDVSEVHLHGHPHCPDRGSHDHHVEWSAQPNSGGRSIALI